jgi:hypothetical protein
MAQMQVRLIFEFLISRNKEAPLYNQKDSAPLLDQHMAQMQVRHTVWIMVSGLGSSSIKEGCQLYKVQKQLLTYLMVAGVGAYQGGDRQGTAEARHGQVYGAR